MSRERSFGPFSGLHLTAIIITALVVVGVPGTVFAVDTFTNVAVQDPVSGVKASVDNQHRLKTLDTISGSISGTTTETTPDKLVEAFASLTSDCQAVYTVPASKGLVLKSAAAYVFPDSGQPGGFFYLSDDSTCVSILGAFISPPPGQTVPLTFGAGLAFKAGTTLYVGSLQASGSINLYGYLVPASAVPANPATTNAATGDASSALRGR